MRVNNNENTISISGIDINRLLGHSGRAEDGECEVTLTEVEDGKCEVTLTEAEDYEPTAKIKKHFKLTDETIEYKNHTLHRIQCTETFVVSNIMLKEYYDKDTLTVKEGEFGGFVESENNLNDDAWVQKNAKVFEDARVYGNALIAGKAEVRDRAEVYGDAVVCGNARVEDDAEVCGKAAIGDNAKIFGHAKIWGTAKINGYAKVRDYAKVLGSSCIIESAVIDDYAYIEDAYIGGNVKIGGDAQIFNITIIRVNAKILNDANISHEYDYMCFDNVGSRNDILTAYRTKHNGVRITIGCFFGDLNEFRKNIAKKDESEILIKKEYELIADVIQHRFIDHNTDDYLKNNDKISGC